MIYPDFPDSTTLGEARAWLREQASGKGAKCPCCTQYSKVYKRALNARMTQLLIMAYRDHGQAWFHISTLRDGTGDFAKLRWWDLVRESTTRRLDGGRIGEWQVTDLGVRFLRAGIQLPAHALVYDNQLLGHDGTRQVTATDALGERFDLAELLADGAGVSPPALDPEPERTDV